MKLNNKGKNVLKEFLLNNHNEGLEIVRNEIWFEAFVYSVEEDKGKLYLTKEELSDGGCYLLTLSHFLEEELE